MSTPRTHRSEPGVERPVSDAETAGAKTTITFDEAMGLISDIARNGEGPDKFRALKVAMDQQSGGVALPPPMSAEEVVERLTRIMRASGKGNCQIAYRKAFVGTRTSIGDAMPDLALADITPFEKNALPRTLRQLYKQFPSIKPRGGVPKGYPMRSGLETQTEWVQCKAVEIMRDREQTRLSGTSEEAVNP